MLESPDMVPRHRASQLYLASNSPRRKELLSLTGLEYHLLPAPVDESPFPHESGAGYVSRIAHSKAVTAASQLSGDAHIITADTAVIDRQGDEDEILGKPGDSSEAVAMLRRLRGHAHQVYTAISIIRTPDGAIWFDLCLTHVPMRNYSDEELQAYVASGDPMDKAGAYAIQHAGFHPVEGLSGCYASVMGLPLCHLVRTLRSLDVHPTQDVPSACQAALGYDCLVFSTILKGAMPDRVVN